MCQHLFLQLLVTLCQHLSPAAVGTALLRLPRTVQPYSCISLSLSLIGSVSLYIHRGHMTRNVAGAGGSAAEVAGKIGYMYVRGRARGAPQREVW